MKDLLFISISFPPKNDPECLQTARYFKYLQQSGKFRITVITSEIPTLYMPKDESLWKYAQGIDQLIEIKIFESKWVNFALRKLGLGSFLFPDSKMTFHWQWRKVVKQIKSKPDFIYSRSNPISSAFMAKKLKAHYKCPWIMHLSDPWALSPLNAIPQKKLKYFLNEESELISTANSVTFTTNGTRQIYANKYSGAASKFSVLPNIYDPKDEITTALSKENKLRIVYTGGLAGQRNISFLFSVLAEAAKRIPKLEEKVEFVFAGDMDRENRKFFLDAPPCITHVGLLSHEEVKKLYQTAHLLLVIDNPTSSDGAIFFPSKILDYFLTRRKIWAVTPVNSTTRQVLADYNHAAFEHTETEAMVNFLLQSIARFTNNELDAFQSHHIPSGYSADLNAALLTEIILKTTNI